MGLFDNVATVMTGGLSDAGKFLGDTLNAGPEAAQKAAEAQQKQAQAWQAYNSDQQKSALDYLGRAPTPSQLSAYGVSLGAQERNVQRMETLAQSLDPGLVSMGKQLKDLAEGKSAPVLSNLQNQRALQRSQLVDQLKQQLGPGAETSTAGQQALSRFDNETANTMSQAQQGYMGQIMNMSTQGGQLGQMLGQQSGNLNDLGYNDPNAVLGRQQAQIVQNFTGMGQQSQNALYQSAGGQYAGDALRAKQNMGLLTAGIGAAGAAFGGMKGGGAAAAPAGQATLGQSTMGGYQNSQLNTQNNMGRDVMQS